MTLRIVFAGTPEFAQTALAAIDAAGFPVELVLTQPDRPAGRGMKLQASPVKRYAQAHGMPVSQPPSLRRNGKYPEEAAAAIEQLRALAPDVMVVAAYGLILPQEVLDLPRYGCLNIHGSLLPRWRGAAPIHRAIEAGDAQTGITIMQMDAGLDTGAMLLREAEPIGPDDTTATLHDRMAALGGRMIVDALQRLARDGKLPGEAQPEAGVTYAEKIAKHEAVLDWRKPAEVLARQVRAFDPFPGALGTVHDTAVKLWRASAVAAPAGAAPGTVLEVSADAIVIACGNGALRVTECQKPGGKRLPVREFLAGFALTSGDVFAAAPPPAT
ncbi:MULTISPECIES: methionyl-tRNA formyltransferase [Pandoraea]|jgi:methionyl-tRNA formyltransferase|uniref:methionyl-tRNA formyltransferase n=1 Tax=Pandoraea TaxID=93217 RepID=UPI0003D23E72|nr:MULTISPECIES: methionyl-tRNA formyltransferase [Pandoraea]AHB75956.1 methionyl-tRNA formyltransferase [Pandoraea pnomenusa]ANC44832.1 methionyl-tRNA formyltransferase [Pandoraea pnomenusa]MBN9092012.1 methionyl-tRNA formyltransferase [Pandoraea pnomenusa]